MGGNILQGEICSGINYKRKMLKFKLQIPQNARSYGSTLTSKQESTRNTERVLLIQRRRVDIHLRVLMGHEQEDSRGRGCWQAGRGGGMLTLEVAAIGGGAGGGRGGLWPHDRGEGALLFDCRNHMDRREWIRAYGSRRRGGGGEEDKGRRSRKVWGGGPTEGGRDGNEQADRQEVSDRTEMRRIMQGGGGGWWRGGWGGGRMGPCLRLGRGLQEQTCSEHKQLHIWQSWSITWRTCLE